MQRILIVDDDHVQVDVVTFLLRREGFDPVPAYDAVSAARLFTEKQPDLVILDVNLGDADGRDLLRRFRKERPRVFIIMLTALDAEEDRVYGLQAGADDYLAKPFGHRELIARVRAMLRRANSEPYEREPAVASRMQLGSLVVDPATHEASRHGRSLDLTPTEFRLLQTLLDHPNELVHTRTIVKAVWGHEDMTARNVLRVTASRLRAKLQESPTSPPMLLTIPGEGLMIRTDTPLLALAPEEPVLAMDLITELRELMADTGSHPLRALNDVYLKFAEKHLQAMHDEFESRDSAALARSAHRLRGTSASMGARRVTVACAIIEERSRAGDLDSIEGLLDQLGQELSGYESEIEPMLD